jgi:hypothetical protein
MEAMSRKTAQSGRLESQRWTSDGVWINIGGDRNWRNHNPGNLEDGDFARRHGAIGSDGRFAIFPDYQTGKNALISLLTTEAYIALTVAGAIERFAPSIENDVSAYAKFIGNECKVGPDTLLSSMSAQELERLAGAIEKFEGGRKGATYGMDDVSAPEIVAQIQRTIQKLTDG